MFIEPAAPAPMYIIVCSETGETLKAYATGPCDLGWSKKGWQAGPHHESQDTFDLDECHVFTSFIDGREALQAIESKWHGGAGDLKVIEIKEVTTTVSYRRA